MARADSEVRFVSCWLAPLMLCRRCLDPSQRLHHSNCWRKSSLRESAFVSVLLSGTSAHWLLCNVETDAAVCRSAARTADCRYRREDGGYWSAR